MKILVYASCRVPQALVEDPVLLGEGMSGALYWKDFIALAKKVGFADPRLMKVSSIWTSCGQRGLFAPLFSEQ